MRKLLYFDSCGQEIRIGVSRKRSTIVSSNDECKVKIEMTQISFEEQMEHYERMKDANRKLAKHLKGDCIFIHSDIFSPLDETLKEGLESLKSVQSQDHLIVMLQTKGGSIELVERLVNIMRHHYKEVSFIIPNYAYSAGTVLVLSGDEIYMSYYSVLGPIDPQVMTSDGSFKPGRGKIWEIEQLFEQINSANSPKEVLAELLILQEVYDPVDFFTISQSIKFGETLIKKWLPKYKFKNWNTTETRKLNVTDEMKLDRAAQIAEKLGDAEFWHSHGRGISLKTLMSDDINLKIHDYSKNVELSGLIEDYYKSATYFFELQNVENCIHTPKKLWSV